MACSHSTRCTRRLLREKRDVEDYCEDVEREMFEKDSLISDLRIQREETQASLQSMRQDAQAVPELQEALQNARASVSSLRMLMDQKAAAARVDEADPRAVHTEMARLRSVLEDLAFNGSEEAQDLSKSAGLDASANDSGVDSLDGSSSSAGGAKSERIHLEEMLGDARTSLEDAQTDLAATQTELAHYRDVATTMEKNLAETSQVCCLRVCTAAATAVTHASNLAGRVWGARVQFPSGQRTRRGGTGAKLLRSCANQACMGPADTVHSGRTC